MNYIQAKYLKSAGKNIDVKVSVRPVGQSDNRLVAAYIRDMEFFSFNKALTYLQHITQNEVISESEVRS